MAGDGKDVADGRVVPVQKDEKIDEVKSQSGDEGIEEEDGHSVPFENDENVHGAKSNMASNIGAVTRKFKDVKLKDDDRGGGPELQAVPTRQPAQPSIRPAQPERLEDVFQDEIIKEFSKSEFKKFALSKDGLCLKQYDVNTIMDDYSSSEEQKFQMLYRWRMKHGNNATPQKIRAAVEAYKKAQLADD